MLFDIAKNLNLFQFGRKATFVMIQMEAWPGLIPRVMEVTLPVVALQVHQVQPQQHPQVGSRQLNPEVVRTIRKDRILEKVPKY